MRATLSWTEDACLLELEYTSALKIPKSSNSDLVRYAYPNVNMALNKTQARAIDTLPFPVLRDAAEGTVTGHLIAAAVQVHSKMSSDTSFAIGVS